MRRNRPRLIENTVNQRLTGLYLIFVVAAVAILALQLPHRSTGFVIAGVIALIVCVLLAKWVARCPSCGLDARSYPVEPAGSKLMRFRNINWFAPERCPHCNADLLQDR